MEENESDVSHQQIPFTMMVERRPLSSNKAPHPNYVATLQYHARSRFAGQPLMDGALYVRIIWLYDGNEPRTRVDVDNIAKWIIDALRGIVYADDQIIVKCAVEKVDTSRRYQIAEETMNQQDYVYLIQRLHDPQCRHMVYVEVGKHTTHLITFGPIDKESV